MRAVGLLILALLPLAPAPAWSADRRVRPGRVGCCLEVIVPSVAPEPRCMLVHLAVRPRRVGARRLCRLVGGRPARPRLGCTCGGERGHAAPVAGRGGRG
jgi:hypothetical protein